MLTLHINHYQTSPVQTAAAPSIQLNQDQCISPESLMAYCAMRLRGVDDQIKAAFAQQQKANADQQALGELTQWMHTYCFGGAGKDQGNTAAIAFEYAIGKVGADTQAGRELAALKQQFVDRTNGDGKISPEDIEKQFIQRVKDITGEVSGGAELNMINLQSLMSQRQMAVQLSTNLIQMLGETTNKVVANIHG